MAVHSVFESFGRLFSRKQIRDIGHHLNSAGLGISAEAFAGYFFINVILFTLILFSVFAFVPSINMGLSGFVGSVFPGVYSWVIMIFFFLISLLISYFVIFALISSILVLKTETRRNAVEVAMPDFLMLVAANIKAGMTLDQAMWYAAKPEFGLLSTEVKSVIKQAFSGKSLPDALDELADRFDSKMFQRTVELIKQASATGGEVAEVLERTSQDARASAILRKEISASLVLYEIFVLFAAVAGTPFLMAVSNKLITVLEKAFSYIPEGRASMSQFSFFKPVAPVVSSSEFYWFSIATIILTSVFSSFIIGSIRTGSKSEGLKYIPFVLVLSYLVFVVVSAVLDQFFVTLT